jgi:hypothetical protein
MNLGYGLYAITALGNFNPQESGQLILWEFKLVIDFPPGSTILIPSAVVTHSNARIAPGKSSLYSLQLSLAHRATGEERMSITEFTAGKLFQYAENGCMTDKDLGKTMSAEEWMKREDAKKAAHLEKPHLFSKLSDLVGCE